MTHTIPVSIDQLQRLEHCIGTLEQAVRDLVHALATEKPDRFASLYHSKAFTAHKKEQHARFIGSRLERFGGRLLIYPNPLQLISPVYLHLDVWNNG